MRERVGSQDARAKLPEMLRRVATGEAFTITRRGKPVADLIPVQYRDVQEARAAQRRTLADTAIATARELRRKYPTGGRKFTREEMNER